MKRLALATCVLMGVAVAACTDSPTAPATPAATSAISANYGHGAAYEIEISSNLPGQGGGGIWLWIELKPMAPGQATGTGDYTGSDCGHGGGARAVADAGDVTWTKSGGTITINGVVLHGLFGVSPTITVPSSYGHEKTDFISPFPNLNDLLAPYHFPTIPAGLGFSQVQVAP